MEVDLLGQPRRCERYWGDGWLSRVPMSMQPRFMPVSKLLGVPSRRLALSQAISRQLARMARMARA